MLARYKRCLGSKRDDIHTAYLNQIVLSLWPKGDHLFTLFCAGLRYAAANGIT